MDKKKTAASAALTAAAVASVVTGAVFDSPSEIVPEALEDDAVEETVVPEARQRGPVARIRKWVLGLPAAVRMLVAIPLWCVGWVLLSAFSVVWGSAAPLLSGLLSWVCLAVVLLGVFALSAKAAFPGVSFKRILRLRNVLLLFGLSALLWIADLALPTVWQSYDLISRTVWRIGAICLLAFLCCAELKHQGRQAVKVSIPALPKRTAVEEEARRLADTVCK